MESIEQEIDRVTSRLIHTDKLMKATEEHMKIAEKQKDGASLQNWHQSWNKLLDLSAMLEKKKQQLTEELQLRGRTCCLLSF
jgi:hypothetical protein